MRLVSWRSTDIEETVTKVQRRWRMEAGPMYLLRYNKNSGLSHLAPVGEALQGVIRG